ncbi:MAG TPA: response regulator [Phycisphaerae bacterium]|nr:response regulator [Phycisphaerae bacterium]
MKRVLIADDDQALVRALAIRCAALGVAAESSPDGLHAVQHIERCSPDLVILDVNMPADGVAVCERLRRDGRWREIPVIVITGRADGALAARCQALGAAYVVKGPWLWSELEPLLRKRLGLDRGVAGAPGA